MTSLIGVFALALAWCGALATAGTALVDGWRGRESPVPRWAATVTLAGTAVAVAAVEWALLRHDFSVAFVADNGSRDTPVYYTVTSLWAAHDGSLLLWNLLLAAALVVVARRSLPGAEALRPWAVGVVGLVACFFLGLAVFAGHVFDRVSPVPADGPGPVPLLGAHPAMGIHPPLLYLGLVGLVVPFGYGAAALVTGETGPGWVRAVSAPARLAWTALTAGIVLGSWWSYAVLGWGGYWGWDPVENSSLMPWLVATALLHSLVLHRRTGSLGGWCTAQAVVAFVLAAVGVVLTRSGAVASVHSFADSGVGPVLLGFVVALTAAAVVLALARLRSSDRTSRAAVPAVSRGAGLLWNNVVLLAFTATVLLGTLVPVVVDLVGGGRVSVGPPYYARMVVPLALVLLALMAAGPLLPWRGTEPGDAVRALALPGLVTGVGVLVLRLAGLSVLTALACSLAAAVATAAVLPRARSGPGRDRRVSWTSLRRTWRARASLGGRVAHVGLAVLAVGITVSSAGSVVGERDLSRGETVEVAGKQVTLVGVERTREQRLMRTAADLEVDGVRLRARLEYFPRRDTTVAGPAISSGPTRDLYATLLSVRQDGSSARVRLAVNPGVGWIWGGGALMVLGGLLVLSGRRRSGRRGGRPVTGRTDQTSRRQRMEVA